MLTIDVHTDGSCLGNPGPGGFAAIMQANGVKKVVMGCSPNMHETNNSMELKAVMHTLAWCNKYQKVPCKIIFYTDSQYVISCWNHDKYWLMTKERPNYKIWTQIIRHLENGKHVLEFVKVKGHSGNKLNEEADRLARQQAIKARHIAYKEGKYGIR